MELIKPSKSSQAKQAGSLVDKYAMLTVKEREKQMEELGCRYGYGSFVGGDGRVHVGIEKVPFVHKGLGEKKGEGAMQRLLDDGKNDSPEAEGS